MTKCPQPCLWLREPGLIDALILGADVSMLQRSQPPGVCGGAGLQLQRLLFPLLQCGRCVASSAAVCGGKVADLSYGFSVWLLLSWDLILVVY